MQIELFEAEPHKSFMRLPKKPTGIIPLRIDSGDSSEIYQKKIEDKERRERMIEGILQARKKRDDIQKNINRLKCERAKIKGKSKASKAARSEWDKLIAELRIKKSEI
jgi:hypothetical protein